MKKGAQIWRRNQAWQGGFAIRRVGWGSSCLPDLDGGSAKCGSVNSRTFVRLVPRRDSDQIPWQARGVLLPTVRAGPVSRFGRGIVGGSWPVSDVKRYCAVTVRAMDFQRFDEGHGDAQVLTYFRARRRYGRSISRRWAARGDPRFDIGLQPADPARTQPVGFREGTVSHVTPDCRTGQTCEGDDVA